LDFEVFNLKLGVIMPETKKISMPNPLTLEWLARFNEHYPMSWNIWQGYGVLDLLKENEGDVLNSREMEIALASHIYIDKEYNLEIDKFFIKSHPNTYKNAMKLAFRHYLDYRGKKTEQEHPHFSKLLELIKEEKGWQEFYEICIELKTKYNILKKETYETWERIKDVPFEKAIMAVNILHIRGFWKYFDRIEQNYDDILTIQNSFIKAANDYLNHSKEYKRQDSFLWKNMEQLFMKGFHYFMNLLEDSILLDKIYIHIQKIGDLQQFRYSICESFIFDKIFEYDIEKKKYSYNNNDDVLVNLKNRVLNEYYRGMNFEKISEYMIEETMKHPDYSRFTHATKAQAMYVDYPLLTHYYGISPEFTYLEQTYDLLEILWFNGLLCTCYHTIHAKEMCYFLKRYEKLSFEENLKNFIMQAELWRDKNRLPIDVRTFANLAECGGGTNGSVFRILSTDISNNFQSINLGLSSILHYKDSELCMTFPYIKATNNTTSLSLLNLLKKSRNDDKSGEQKRKESEKVEENIANMFLYFPAFKNAKMIRNKKYEYNGNKGEIDLIIYKDNTLFLIEIKSTFGILTFDERHKHEKQLMYAGHQLERAKNAIKNSHDLLIDITDEPKISLNEVKLETLIVSTSFEFDNEKFSGHRKISLLELMVYLHNDAFYLIMTSPKIISPELYEKALSNPKEIEPNEIYSKINKLNLRELSLYNTDNPTIVDFLKALNSNIWEKILPYWQEKM